MKADITPSCRRCGSALLRRFCASCGTDSQCHGCGATLTDDSCPTCGLSADPVRRTPAALPSPLVDDDLRSRSTLQVVGALIGAAILVAAAAWLWTSRSGSTTNDALPTTGRTIAVTPTRGSSITMPTVTTTTAAPTAPVTGVATFDLECSPARLAAVLASRGVTSANAIATLRCSGNAGTTGWAFVHAPGASPDTQFLLRYEANTWRVAYAGSDALAAASSSLDLLNQGLFAPDINILFCQPRQGYVSPGC